MADSEVVLPGTGEKVDTRVVDTDQHRQVVVIGDPSNVANVASVDGNGDLGTIVKGHWSIPAPSLTLDADAVLVANLGGNGSSHAALGVAAGNMVFNGSTWDRVRSVQAYKTAAAAPVEPAASIAPDRNFTSVNLATAVNSTQSWDVNGADSAAVRIGNTTTGTMTFEVSADGTNWIQAQILDVGTGLWANAPFTPSSGKVYKIYTLGYRSLRARTVTTLGATVALVTTLAADTGIVNAQRVNAAPHAIGFAHLSNTVRLTASSTGTNVLTTTVGRTLVITYFQIQAGGTTAGEVQLFFGTGTYTRGTNRAIFDGEFAPSATNRPGVVQSGTWVAPTDSMQLRVASSAAINPLTVVVHGYEFMGV